MLSIGTHSQVGRRCSESKRHFKNCEPPRGNWVSSCSISSRYSGTCSDNCQLRKLTLRSAVSSLRRSASPFMFDLTMPSGGRSSFDDDAAKSTHASAIIGCTTFDAPLNVAPPGASLPKPVLRKPSSYCLSRCSRDSLSTSINSRYSTAKASKTSSGSSSAKLA